MLRTKEKFIVDKKGKPVQVVLDIKDFKKIIEDLEELDCIRVYDNAKKSGDKRIPFAQAIKEIESKKK